MANNPTNISAEPGRPEIVITRDFAAPRELVFKAFTDPALYVQWMGPRRFKTTLQTFTPQKGGEWRYIHTDTDGSEYGFHGVYHEVLAPELIVDTFEFEGLPEKGHVSLETIKLTELPGGRTGLTSQSIFQSVADRDGMLQSGAEEGISESYERLAELLQRLMS